MHRGGGILNGMVLRVTNHENKSNQDDLVSVLFIIHVYERLGVRNSSDQSEVIPLAQLTSNVFRLG
jgi:hypothetical protein